MLSKCTSDPVPPPCERAGDPWPRSTAALQTFGNNVRAWQQITRALVFFAMKHGCGICQLLMFCTCGVGLLNLNVKSVSSAGMWRRPTFKSCRVRTARKTPLSMPRRFSKLKMLRDYISGFILRIWELCKVNGMFVPIALFHFLAKYQDLAYIDMGVGLFPMGGQ